MSYIKIEVDTDDILSEIDTDELIDELETRTDLPAKYRVIKEGRSYSKTPKRDAIISVLDLHPTATLADIWESIETNYNK